MKEKSFKSKQGGAQPRLHVTGGTRAKKSGLGERWSFQKLGDLPTPPAREAPVSLQEN